MPKLPTLDLTYHFRLLTDVRVGDVLPSSDDKLMFAELHLAPLQLEINLEDSHEKTLKAKGVHQNQSCDHL